MNVAGCESWVLRSGKAADGEMWSCSWGPTADPLSPGPAWELRMGSPFLLSSSPARAQIEESEISLVYS